MPPFDGKAMAADILAAVRDYVARAVAPMQAEIRRAFDEAAAIKAMVDAVEKIPIPKDGEPGKQGEPGKDADPAVVAALICKEALPDLVIEKIRAEWERLFDVEIMPKFEAIPKPKDGEPGRDAAHLEIMPAIDESRSYPRGTYAKHANGFWRAFEQTQGMRGWECLVAGVAAVEVTWAHEREFTVSHTLSDGTVSAQVFKLPVLIYRGVYVEGRQYEHGDQVSWGAHQWHCNEPTTDKPIEGGKAWTLAVKRGRDGKEGPAGPAGKDRIVKEKA